MKFKYFVLPIFFLSVTLIATAQEKSSVYTIKKGDNLYSLSHRFHVTEAQLKEANGMGDGSVLKIGQKIKIPKVSAQKNTQKQVVKQPAEPIVNTDVPASSKKQIHIVAGKETLWSISKKYGVTVAQIKTWNHLTTDAIHTGQKLIVAQPAAAEQVPVTNTQPEQKTVRPVEQKPVVEEKKAAVVEQHPAATEPQTAVNTTASGKDDGESYYAFAFKNNGNQLSGTASTFKTASGWLDKKYYVLINNVTEGSIVAVSTNNKTIYAKVLGALPDIKEDNGVLLRISNAAASVLGVTDNKFAVTVSY